MGDVALMIGIAGWLLFACTGLSAAEFRAEEQSVVESDEVIEDDLYIFGDEVTIDGQVKGDVIAFGRLIKMNGSVEGDFIAAGQAIVIAGNVGDDVRMAAQVLKVDKNAGITDDLIAAGFSFEFTESSSIDGDLVYAGYQALVDGDIKGKLNSALVNCEINGHIGGDVDLSVGVDEAGPHAYTQGQPPPVSMPSVPAGLTIGETAQIDGGLDYKSRQEANIAGGAQISGEIKHERPPVQAQRAPTPTERALGVARQYLTLFIIGLCVVLVVPSWTRRMSDNIGARPLACLGFGAAGIVGFIVLVPMILVAMVALAVIAGVIQLTGLVPVVIVLGLSSAVALMVSFWFVTSYLSQIVFSLFAGNRLLGLASLGENRFLSLLVGVVILAVIHVVPYLGLVVGLLVVLFGLGAVVVWLLRRSDPDSAANVQPQPAE